MTTLWELNRKPRLLVIEHDRDIGNMFKVYFGSAAEVTVVNRSQEALEVYATHLFDLVVVDMDLPGLDVYEFMKSIRVSGNKVPLLFLTQNDEYSHRLQMLEIDADDYVLKPFDIEDVKTRIKRGLKYRVNYLK